MNATGIRVWTPKSLMFRIVVLLLCTLIPLQCMGLWLYSYGYQTIASQIEKASISALTSMNENMKAEVRTLYADLYEIENNMELRRVAYYGDYLPRYRYYQSVSTLQEYLSLIATNNQLVESIYVYMTQSGYCLSSSQRVGYGDTVSRYEAYDPEEVAPLIAAAKSHRTDSVIHDDAVSYVPILYPESCYLQDKQPTFVVQIRLSRDQLRRFLASGAQEEDSMALAGYETDAMLTGEGSAVSADTFRAFWQSIRGRITTDSVYSGEFSYSGVAYFATACHSESLNASFLRLVPREKALSALAHYENSMYIYAAVSVALFILCVVMNLHIVRNPIRKLVKGFQDIEGGNYDVQVSPEKDVAEMACLMDGFNHMAQRLNDTVNRLYKQEIYTQRMELSQLHMQINPHFLFNTYFMMDRLLQSGDYDIAGELSSYLGEYFRYINRDARRFVTLVEEWTHMHSYARIQQLRYARRLKLEIEPVPEQYNAYLLPRLVLQPVVENSIEHGLSRTDRDGLSVLRFQTDGDLLRIIVEDNGVTATDELIAKLTDRLRHYDTPGQETSALINIHRRLQLFFGEGYGIALSRSGLGGLRTEIRLPAKGRKEGLQDADAERADR